MPTPISQLEKMPCNSANGKGIYMHPTELAMSGATGVYFWVLIRDGRMYVGSGSSTPMYPALGGIKKRYNDHIEGLRGKYHFNQYIQRAWNKYGESAFIFGVLEYCPSKNCVDREQFWLDYYEAASPKFGFNSAPVAGSMLGFKHSDETKKKLSEANKSRDPEICKRQGEKLRGRKHSKETCEKRSKGIKKSWEPGGKRHGYKHSDDVKEKIGDIQRGKPKPGVADALTGKHQSEESKANKSKALKEYWDSPEGLAARDKVSKEHTGRKHSDLAKMKMAVKAQAAAARKRKIKERKE